MSQSLILEIRPAAGGDESYLFSQDLIRMYKKYSLSKGWDFFELEELKAKIKGEGAFDKLQNEAGVHRVQRVPRTEKAGRVHTSTATVAVLPSFNLQKASEVELRPQDMQIEFFRSGGKGGQNVNKVSTAVRLIHIPTGTMVEAQEERTQFQNRQIAEAKLRQKLSSSAYSEAKREVDTIRSGQVGTGDRVEKIRTYNFPQNRITDHRLDKSFQNLEAILDGKLDQILKHF